MNVILKHHTPLYICSDAVRTCWQSQDKSDKALAIICDKCGNIDRGDEEEGYTTFEMNIGDDNHHECLKCHSEKNHWETLCGPKDKELIHRVGIKFRHASTLEHLSYNFEISGISRALLQELARHRIASLSVKSTRYTLKELKSEESFTEYTDISHQEYNKDGRVRAEKYLVMTGDERVDRMSILALDNLRDLLVEGISNDKAKYALPESYKTELTWTVNARSLQNFLSLRTDKAALWEIRDLANLVYNNIPEDHKYLFEQCIYVDKTNEESK